MDERLEQAAARVARGDRAAFRTVVELTSARLYRLAARIMGGAADAEDALQDAYLRAFQALSGQEFDGRASVSSWLYRIATNACLDALRRRRPRPAAERGEATIAREPSFDGLLAAEARAALREIDRWLGELPPEQRAALVLKTMEEMTSAEIGELLGCSEGAVEQLLVRARAALRQHHGEGS
ncbi:MAG: RNA polymerase sigma factor [Deltaproteobacteria bacterium]|nr:RNA polymerase sigma factor [Deltaproteobacteria bacterium]